MVAKSLRVYLFLLAGLWAAALGWCLFQAHVLHHGYPADTLFLAPEIRFSDFTIFDPRFRIWSRDTTAFFDAPGFPFPYPAPTLAVFLAFWNFTPQPLYFYLATVALFALAAVIMLSARYPELRFALAGSLLGSFPLFFLMDRANIEGAVWIAASLGIWAFTRRNFRIASILLGLAAAMKIFPALLLLLFLTRKRYREFGFGLLSAALCTVASLAVAGPSPGIVFARLTGGLDFFRMNVILPYLRFLVGFEHSGFACVKQIVHAFWRFPQTENVIRALYLPYAAVAVAGFTALYWFRIRHMPTLNQLFALSILSVTLPFVSFDYTLVHLYIPFSVFLIVLVQERLPRRIALPILLPCACIFSPLNWIRLADIGFAAQAKTLLLGVLLAIILKTPIPSALFGERKKPFAAIVSLPGVPLRGIKTVS